MKAPEKMSWQELQAADRAIRKAILRARAREWVKLRKEMDQIAAAHGFRLRDLFGKEARV